MPPEVAASSGLDILSHAIESFTAHAVHRRAAARRARRCGRPTRARTRSATSGRSRRCAWWPGSSSRAVDDPGDDEAREQMLLAASYAGVGFGNAGVHLPHGMSYPVSGHVKIVPRAGISRPTIRSCRTGFRSSSMRRRCSASRLPPTRPGISQAAEALGADVSRRRRADAGHDSRRPHHLVHAAARGSRTACARSATRRADIPALVEGTLPQHRVTKLSPRPAGPEELAALFEDAMVAW